MTQYDRIMHTLGLASISLLGLSASPDLYKHLPWWLLVLASVVAGVAAASTMPVVNRPVAIASSAATNAAVVRDTGTTPTVTP